jgi:uncharacterized membrane protein
MNERHTTKRDEKKLTLIGVEGVMRSEQKIKVLSIRTLLTYTLLLCHSLFDKHFRYIMKLKDKHFPFYLQLFTALHVQHYYIFWTFDFFSSLFHLFNNKMQSVEFKRH